MIFLFRALRRDSAANRCAFSPAFRSPTCGFSGVNIDSTPIELLEKWFGVWTANRTLAREYPLRRHDARQFFTASHDDLHAYALVAQKAEEMVTDPFDAAAAAMNASLLAFFPDATEEDVEQLHDLYARDPDSWTAKPNFDTVDCEDRLEN